MLKIKLIQVLRNDKELAMFNSFIDVEAPKPSKVKYKYSTVEIEVNILKYFIVDLFGGYE